MTDTYHCDCGHDGSAIWQQAVKVGFMWTTGTSPQTWTKLMGLTRSTWRKLVGMGAKIRYACWACGMEVKAGG